MLNQQYITIHILNSIIYFRVNRWLNMKSDILAGISLFRQYLYVHCYNCLTFGCSLHATISSDFLIFHSSYVNYILCQYLCEIYSCVNVYSTLTHKKNNWHFFTLELNKFYNLTPLQQTFSLWCYQTFPLRCYVFQVFITY